MATFGDNLKRLRSEKNISQGELAQMVNMHATHISRYERNLTSPSIEVLKRIAEKMDVSTDVLLYGSIDEKTKNNIQDSELLNMFKKVQVLEQQDVSCIKSLLNAYLFKREMQHRLV